MTLGGDDEACEYVLPALRKFAARASNDNEPCVARVGPDGAGHYVKMVHNGIEQGQLGALCEVVALLRSRMSWDDVSDVMSGWNEGGELKGTYLVGLAGRVARTKKEGGQHVVDEVLDKVVQDNDDSEGTGVWSIMETVARHISAPAIASAHYMRVASGNRATRVNVSKKMDIMPQDQQQFGYERMKDRQVLVNTLNLALTSAFFLRCVKALSLLPERQSKKVGTLILQYVFEHGEQAALFSVMRSSILSFVSSWKMKTDRSVT
jgi:6-phosphogluconate dehydrogenase